MNFKTKNQLNIKAVKYNPTIAINLANDSDYCTHKTVQKAGFDLYIDTNEYIIYALAKINKLKRRKNEHSHEGK